MDKVHVAGTFELRVEEQPLDVMWEAYRMTLTLILPAKGGFEGLDVNAMDLENALSADRQLTSPD